MDYILNINQSIKFILGGFRMKELGEFLGWLIIISYGLTVLNFIVKAVNKKYSKQIAKNIKFKKHFTAVMRFIIKNHKFFGFATVGFILIHFAVQFTNRGLNITGLIAAIIMILQIFLGMYGAYINKKRAGAWFYTHRTIAAVLLAAIFIHIL